MDLTKDQLNTYADPTWFPEPGRYLHLDNEYRRKYCLFFLNNGVIEDTRVKNWREVEWEKVNKILVSIRGNEVTISPHPTNHKFFLFFRQWGIQTVYEDFADRIGTRDFIRLWTVGVTDGKECFLYDIDFHTGKVKRVYNEPLPNHTGHIHPRIKTLDKIYQVIKG